MKTKILILIFPFFVYQAFSATNAVQYSMPGAVELRVKNGTCSGSIVGDSPIKVLTAEHCLANLSDGGVEIIDPAVMQAEGKVKWIKSSKVFTSKGSEYRAVLEKKYNLALQMEELHLVIAKATIQLGSSKQQASGQGLLGSLFLTPKKALSKEEEDNLIKVVEDSLSDMARISVELKSISQSLSMRYADHDLAVLVFPVSLPGEINLEQRVKNREILPLARSSLLERDIPVVIGGFGVTSTEPQARTMAFTFSEPAPLRSHFTTNKLSKNNKRSSIYNLFGHTTRNLEKAKLAPATMGSPLPGDSGSAVISEQGILAVTSTISFYSSHVPPAPNWVNSVDDTDSPVERYEYILANFPSTSSATAQALFADVEASSGPLVFADQVAEYSKVFVSEKQSILAIGTSNPLLELIPFPTVDMVIK